jgi:integrase
MALTDLAIKKAVFKDGPYRLTDSKGLTLLIHPNGSKYWQFRYRFADKGKLLALGVYPEISLAEARIRCDKARKQLYDGIDPCAERKLQKLLRVQVAENNFQAVAVEWFAKQGRLWCEKHAKKTWWLLEKNLFPGLGSRPVSDIKPVELLAVLRRLEARGAYDTAKRAKQVAGQVFRYAIATGRADLDPTPALKGALATSAKQHFAAITEPKKVGPLLVVLDGYQGSPIVRAALQLAPLTFVRPGELRKALWIEIDFDNAEWRIPGPRMKTRQPHVVPLSRQALNTLKELELLTGHGEYLFPSPRSPKRPMSDNTVLAAMRRLGIAKEEMTGHGFRAMARTILDEVLNYRVDWIEHQLAHEVKDVNGRAYNRTAHLDGRKKMMQGWADYLDMLRSQASGSNVIPIQPHVETKQ